MEDLRVEIARGLSADAQPVLCALDATTIVIEAAPQRLETPGDQAALINLVNLCSRLFAHIEIAIPADPPLLFGPRGARRLREHLVALAQELRPPSSREPSERLHIAWATEPGGPGLAADGRGWSYSVGASHRPLASAEGPALGALAGSSFAVAQAFGRVLTGAGVQYSFHPSPGFTANLLDYGNIEASAGVSVPGSLGPGVVAGAGSVGSSLIYCAELLAIEGGPLDLVDPDRFAPRNVVRYPILRGDVSGPKVAWLAARPGRLDLRPNECEIAGFVARHPSPPSIGLMAVSVDTAEGRRDATDALAATTLNAGVDGLRLHVARHGFGEEGCAYCQYVDLAPLLSGSQQLAERLGLAHERVLAIQVQRQGVLSEEDAAAISAADRPGTQGAAAGDRLADIDRRAYAQAEVVQGDQRVRVAAPFVSAMAGLLLLVEALKEAQPALVAHRLQGRFDVDMSGEPSGFVRSHEPDPSGRCLCHSTFRRRAHKRLHRA